MIIQVRLWLNTAMGIVALILVGITGLYFTNQVASISLALFEDQARPVLAINKLKQFSQEIHIRLLAHASSSEESEMIQIEGEITKLLEQAEGHFQAYFSGAGLTEEEITQVKQTWGAYLQVKKNVIDLSRNYATEEAVALLLSEGRQHFEAFGNLLQAKVQLHETAMGQMREDSLSARSQAINLIAVLGLLAVSLTLAVSYSVIRNITRLLTDLVGNLGDSSHALAEESSQISNNAGELAAGSARQAASIQETSASTEELSAQTQDNAKNAEVAQQTLRSFRQMLEESGRSSKKAANLAEDAQTAAQQGVQFMGELSSSLREIQNVADRVIEIIDILNEITHQTKMLATNAAIEAARAGDQGKGFAVVANEVSQLAENSKTSAKNISKLIHESAQKAKAGNELAGKGQGILQNIFTQNSDTASLVKDMSHSIDLQLENMVKVDQMIEHITQASSEQARGVQQINQAMGEIDQVTQSNAAHAEITASSAEELKELSKRILNLVTLLQSHIRRGEAAAAGPAALATASRPTQALPLLEAKGT